MGFGLTRFARRYIDLATILAGTDARPTESLAERPSAQRQKIL